jgi:molybdopterin/thiamine biosynthesis adenylyltransferase
MGIFNASNLRVCLIGAGGIGAITGITLGKMGVDTVHVFDNDKVDEVNIATQFYTKSDVGLPKALALLKSIKAYSDSRVVFWEERVSYNEFDLPEAEVYISTVDSIASRQDIWESIMYSVGLYPTHLLEGMWYLDARMGAEVFELFTVNLANTPWYSNHIRKASDDDIPDLPCTSKATIYTANIAAGHIGAAVRRIVTGGQRAGLLQHDIINNTLTFLDV